MQRIAIADDEAPIREWLGFCLQRANYPCEIVGLASNGEEALALVRSARPDVLITDIRMPVLDGLDLIEAVGHISPAVGIVVLSSHDDFDYVRRAMKAGASEYILKTEITDTLLVGILSRMKRRTAENGRNDQGHLVPKRTILLKRLLASRSDQPRRGAAELEECGVFLADAPLFAVALRFDAAAGIPAVLDGDSDPILAFANRIGSPVWFPNDRDTAILVANMTEAPSPLMRSRILGDFIPELASHFGASAGASRIHPGLDELGTAMREALDCLDLDFYTGKRSWNRMDERENIDVAPVLAEYRKRIAGSVLAGDAAAARMLLREASDYLARTRPVPVSLARGFFGHLDEAIRDRTGSAEGAESPDRNSLAAMTGRLDALLAGLSSAGREHSPPVRKAIAHMNSNSLKSVSLNGMAALSGLNPDYFSRLFKEETGSNFVVWLSELKVRRAMSLLRETDLRVHEIADEVGYSNLGYFSKVFKKQTGLNPFEFRKSLG